jgi:2-polyprenyl-3-methyl-5-hydroxy-6-metoxy-1,4-benzoquinol methylase
METASIKARVFSDVKYARGRECLQTYKREMLKMVPQNRRLTILDLGCGTGEMSTLLCHGRHQVIGLDISQNAMKKFGQRHFPGIVATLEEGIPFQSESFDMLWCSEVIEHLRSPERFLAECCRILKPGGQLLLSTPNSSYYAYRILRQLGVPWSRIQHPGHLQFFTYSSLYSLLRRQGFRLISRLGYNVYAAFPVRLTSRFGQYSSGTGLSSLLTTMGFTYEEGLIHGNKWVWSQFSQTANDLFSITIIIQANKPRGRE